MSTAGAQTAPTPETPGPRLAPARHRHRLRRTLAKLLAVAVPLALAGFAALRLNRSLEPTGPGIPVAKVKRGDVTFTVTARGKLQGGNPENLAAPMTSGGELRITALKKPGETVKAGEVVLQFDTTEQAFKFKEAESDLAESEQQVLKARAESEAQQEENAYSLVRAKADVRQAELEVRRNPLVSTITAKQNDLALEAARDRLAQIEHDLVNRSASSQAAIELQQAARQKAQTAADTARRNIEQMTVRAKRDGYVSVRQNTNVNFFMTGMTLPLFKVGDRANPGMVIAEIPDLEHWELTANIGELDRGHLAAGQKVEIRVVALPFRDFTGRIKNIGGTTGPIWDRHFECSMTIDNPAPELRPGMNADIVITTEVMRNVLWLPGQAVFESDGRTHVFVPSGSGFAPHDVKVLRRSESQVVIAGLNEGQAVALASPDQQSKQSAGRSGAMQAIPR
jgi:HlyD family secretion protein